MRIRKGPPDTSARRRLPALILAIVAAAHGAPQPSSPPQRIISTAPSITEILYALGLGPRVAGVTRFCRYPPEAQLKPKIGDYINPNLEAIAALKPDLVIIQNNPVRLAQRLSTLRLRTLEVRQESLADIYAAIAAIAQSAVRPRSSARA
jgi:iron complex transport system substrate-binding protein